MPEKMVRKKNWKWKILSRILLTNKFQAVYITYIISWKIPVFSGKVDDKKLSCLIPHRSCSQVHEYLESSSTSASVEKKLYMYLFFTHDFSTYISTHTHIRVSIYTHNFLEESAGFLFQYRLVGNIFSSYENDVAIVKVILLFE